MSAFTNHFKEALDEYNQGFKAGFSSGFQKGLHHRAAIEKTAEPLAGRQERCGCGMMITTDREFCPKCDARWFPF